MENAVICSGVTKSFGEGDTKVQVLRKLDLEIEMGQLAMLMGPSGWNAP
jgi:putative ABC transport system ATP-binding protein